MGQALGPEGFDETGALAGIRIKRLSIQLF